MKVICSYCRRNCGEKEPLEDQRISHGMCNACYKRFTRQLNGVSLSEYLNEIDAPVLIVNRDGRNVAINRRAKARLGRTDSEVTGLLGGEVMECDFARLPEGCGKTVHCETCTIRRTVMHTLESGQELKHQPVTLRRNGREINMTISTQKIDDMVRIVIEE